jgi:hypothetical protein
MLECKKCKTPTARMVSKRELEALSKKVPYAKAFAVPAAVGTAATIAAAAGAAGASSALPGLAKVAASAAKEASPKQIMIGIGVAAAGTLIAAGVKHMFAKRADGNQMYIYCHECGGYEKA